jgi:hypothetical protein
MSRLTGLDSEASIAGEKMGVFKIRQPWKISANAVKKDRRISNMKNTSFCL